MRRSVMFGFGLETGLHEGAGLLKHASQADRDGLDLVSLSDHPYFADRLDAYAALGVLLGRTTRITGAVNVTNLPSRPAPMLARTVTALSALTGGRIVVGMGAGGLWDDMARLGIPRRSPGAAVRAMAEAITLIRLLSGGGPPVTFHGEFYQVAELEPAAVPTPPIWTGSLGPKALAVTGTLADGWLPGHAADWRSDRVAQSRPLIDQAATSAGRDPADVATIYNLPGRITAKPLARSRDDDGRWIGGSARQWIDELVTAADEHHAGGFIYFPVEQEITADMALGRWARDIVPAVREALRGPGSGGRS